MKKKLTLLFVALLAMTAFAGVWHAANRAPEVAQEWDFTQAFSADDLSNLMADPGNWNDENANQTRFGNATAIENAQLKAKEKVIEWTKGLVFVKFAANNKVRLNPGKSLGLNGNNLSIQIPVQKGDKVTVKWQTAKSSEGSRYLSADNLDVITGFKDPASNEIQTSDGTAKEAGYVTITTTGGGINIFSIKVESAEEPNPDPQPGGETTTDPYFQKITSTADLTLGEYLIVNEDAGIAFNGGLETLDAVDDVIAVGVDNGKIVSSQASEEAKFTLEAGGYFKSNSGFYIGLNNSSNGLKQSADFNEAWKHTITFDDQGNAVIIISGSDWSKHLRYNKNNGQNRFRYYNEGAQQPVQLYKKIFPAAEPTSTTVDKLYIIGDVNGWDLTNMSEMTWNSESNAFEFEINVSSEQNFAISDVASLEKDDWDGFKASHRYTLEGGGKYDNIAGQYAQLVQVHGDECINVPSGKYLIRVTKDLQIAMFLQGPYEESDATIEKVVLLGSFNGWNQEADGMQKQDGANTWTATLDGRGISENIEFKLLVNGGSWLGVNEMEIDAPAPWYGSGEYGNIALYHPTTGYDTYTITAVWTPNSNAASGWKLTIAGKDARKTDVAVEVKEGEDIAAAAQAAAEQTNANVTLNLTEGATYELSQPLVVNNTNDLTINGNGATIDASKIEGALFKYQAPKAEGAPRRASLKPEWEGKKATVTIKDLNINDLANTFFEYKDADNMRFDINVENVVVEIVADKVVFDVASSGAFVENLNINKSTFYAPTATEQSFFKAQSAKNGGDVYDDAKDGTALQTFKFENSTFYNLAKGKNFFTLRQNGQKFLAFNMQNNIFVNCGKSGQTVKGLNQGQASANPTWNIDGNLFNFDGDDKSAAESTGDADEPVMNSVAGVITFVDAENGKLDYMLVMTEEGAAAPENLGDSRWSKVSAIIPDVATMNKLVKDTEFAFNGEAIVVAKETKKNAVYVYIKDASGSSLIYDNDGSKTKDLEVGKTIQAGWKGQVSYFNGLFEVVPADALAVTDAAAQEIDYPEPKTMRVFNANNVNKIYKVKNITLSDVDGSYFKVKKSTLEIAGYNQFDGVLIGEGLVCDEVIAAVGIYEKDGNTTVQLQPIKVTAKAFEPVAVNMSGEGDITEAIAAAKAGKNPSSITVNLGLGKYEVSAPIIACGDVVINGNGANIDASGLTGPMIKMSTYPSVAGTAVGSVTAYQVGKVEINEINVDNLSQNLFDCNKTNYLFENVTLNKSIVAIKGASKKTIFNFNGGGNTKNLTVSGSTLYADDATEWQNGGFYSSQSGSAVDQLGGTEQKTTIENSTLFNICKGKTTSSHRKNSQAWMTYEVKNSIIVNSGKNGEFVKGLNGGNYNGGNWVVENSSFTYGVTATSKGMDVTSYVNEEGKMKGEFVDDNLNKRIEAGTATINPVYGEPLFRKLWASDGTMTGDFTLGVCAQIGKQVGDPRWYNIPMITKLQEALDKAAALLDVAQADWQTAPAANKAIEMLAGAYNENVPYLDSNSQEEVDDATLRVEAAIAEFEKVYGSNPTAIKSVDAVKADGDAWYTINGQRISTPTEKGIYIHNGKKVVVK